MISVREMTRKAILAAAAVAIAMSASAVRAPAASAAEPWWNISSTARPTNLPPGGSGKLQVFVANVGDAAVDGGSSPVEIVDQLPAGVTATSASGLAGMFGTSGPMPCSVQSAGKEVSCEFKYQLVPFEQLEVKIGVKISAGAEREVGNEVTVVGGGAPSKRSIGKLAVSATAPAFGFEAYEVTAEDEGGASDTQAGSHPFQLTSTLFLNQTEDPLKPPALAKDLQIKLPTGLIGNPTVFPQCSEAVFVETFNLINACPADTVLGVAIVTLDEPRSFHEVTVPVPVFNLTPAKGEPARFGFAALGVPVIMDTSVRTGEDYGVTVNIQNITQVAAFIGSRVTFWGVPGDPQHDTARDFACLGNLWPNDAEETAGLKCLPTKNSKPPAPFLTMPTQCSNALVTEVNGDSWQIPSRAGLVAEPIGYTLPQRMDGCNRLAMRPEIVTHPDLPNASSPAGMAVNVHVPQDAALNPTGTAESELKEIEVALPDGVTVNPGGAGGLQACTQEEVGFMRAGVPSAVGGLEFSSSKPSCPQQSKIATVKIATPLLPNPLEGAVYLAKPDPLGRLELGDNPFNSLIVMYLVAEDPVSGALVKLPMQVQLNETTGRLVATVENPQLPFEDAELDFFGGGRAPLATPGLCGSYTTDATFTPWSGGAQVTATSTFKITAGPNGSACPSSPRPFTPELNVGTTNNQAGGFSELRTTMGHPDQDQALGGLKMTLPPGLMGTLSKVKLCPEPQASEGTCGSESLIGHTTVTAGLGSTPAVVARPGNVYITTGYKGAPYGLSIANPAETGPFDLEKGTACDCIVVRAKVEVDPHTAQLTITSDPLPQMIDGIPLDLQHVSVQIDRPDFTFNPTSCAKMKIEGSMSGSEGALVPISEPFQAANCARLPFKPSFKVSTSSKTSRNNGADLHVLLTYPNAPQGTQANIKSVHVELPKALPSRLSTLNHACVDSVFNQNPANCPSESRVGFAKAVTPVLPVPLEGPAYFVSHGGQKFPELIVVLQGYGVTVDLRGETFISKAGITSSTFKSVPDVPVGSFELALPEGPFSALAANRDLCTASLSMPTRFTGQNGAVLEQKPAIEVQGCPYALRIVRRHVHKRNLTLRISVPVAGKLVAFGKGVSKASKSAKGRQTLTLTLKERQGGKLRTRIALRFTPAGPAGKQRGKKAKVLHKRLTVTFR